MAIFHADLRENFLHKFEAISEVPLRICVQGGVRLLEVANHCNCDARAVQHSHGRCAQTFLPKFEAIQKNSGQKPVLYQQMQAGSDKDGQPPARTSYWNLAMSTDHRQQFMSCLKDQSQGATV